MKPKPNFHVLWTKLRLVRTLLSLAQANRLIARLTSLQSQSLQPRKLGLGKDRFTMPLDFDHLYADEIQNMFELS